MGDFLTQGRPTQLPCAKLPDKAMDWDDIRIFLQVARHGRMGEAARALNIDHSTVSRRLARLEAELGTLLFERAGRRIRLTAPGAELLATAETIESLMLQKVESLGAGAQDLSGRVRIGAPEGLGAAYIGGRLGAIALAYPKLELELVALPRAYSLAAREVDIAITLDRPTLGRQSVRKLTDYSLELYGTAAYVARMGAPTTTADLARHLVCGYIPELLFTGELDYLHFDGLDLVPQLRSTSVVAQADMIESGAALGILPAFMARRRPGLIHLLPGAIALRRSYWISIHEDLRHLARIRMVLDAIVEAARADRAVFLPEG